MAIEELAQLPSVRALALRAAWASLTGRVGPPEAPPTELLVRGVTVDRARLVAYTRICGFRVGDALAPTYPHVLAFPLALELMTRPSFPFPVAGLVHLRTVIDIDAPLDASASLDLSVRAENLREHDRGRAIDLVTIAVSDARAVWRERSTYLRRTRAKPTARSHGTAAVRPESPAPVAGGGETAAVWDVPADIGRAYARISGDHNPIHTSQLAARLFGFPRPIAHGMWTMARSIAALEGRLPAACHIDVSLRSPLLLPATVAFTEDHGPDGEIIFGLRDALTRRTHLTGSVV